MMDLRLYYLLAISLLLMAPHGEEYYLNIKKNGGTNSYLVYEMGDGVWNLHIPKGLKEDRALDLNFGLKESEGKYQFHSLWFSDEIRLDETLDYDRINQKDFDWKETKLVPLKHGLEDMKIEVKEDALGRVLRIHQKEGLFQDWEIEMLQIYSDE